MCKTYCSQPNDSAVIFATKPGSQKQSVLPLRNFMKYLPSLTTVFPRLYLLPPNFHFCHTATTFFKIIYLIFLYLPLKSSFILPSLVLSPSVQYTWNSQPKKAEYLGFCLCLVAVSVLFCIDPSNPSFLLPI